MKKTFVTLLFLCILGLIISVITIRIHSQISTDIKKESCCRISRVMDCNTILASSYAKLGPFFNAELCLSFYLLSIWGVVIAWISKKRLSVLLFLFIGALFFVVHSVIFALIPLVKLGSFCPLSVFILFINLAIFFLLPSAMNIHFLELPSTLKNKLLKSPKALLAYLLMALIFLGMGFSFSRKLNPNARYSFGLSPEVYLKSFYSLSQKEIQLPERPLLGNPKALVTILAFSDFQCPACLRAEAVLKPFLEQRKDQLRIIYLNYPLNSSCNPTVRGTKQVMGCVAAKESLCAFQDGKFSEYHNWVIKNRTANTFDDASFKNCLVSEKTAGLLKKDIEIATQFKVDTFPTFYINGRKFTDWLDAERLQLVLESELSRVQKH